MYGSHEVVVEFASPSIDNNKTFYTDSNGLEMQKRILNHRDTYDLNINYNEAKFKQNVSANWYPINSAILIQDTKRPAEYGNLQLTVMNDRAQGGSALEKGKIQLMQHRRVFEDDHKGMDEYVNERDIYGKGIRVPATYYVELIDTNNTKSAQHLIHHKTDDPAQMFFMFDSTHAQLPLIASSFGDDISAAGVNGPITYAAFPEEKNSIQIRLENLDDS